MHSRKLELPRDLQIEVLQSFDNVRWQSRNATADIKTTSLVTTDETLVQGQEGNSTPRQTAAYTRLRIRLGGTSPSAQVPIGATDRDPAEGSEG